MAKKGIRYNIEFKNDILCLINKEKRSRIERCKRL
ncbi:hypothetical protein AusDCA_1823 [Desulfitobacterium sp. AusDCA]